MAVGRTATSGSRGQTNGRQRGVPLKYFSHRTKREEGMVITQRLSNEGRKGRASGTRSGGRKSHKSSEGRASGRAGEVTFSSFLCLFFIQRYEEKERERRSDLFRPFNFLLGIGKGPLPLGCQGPTVAHRMQAKRRTEMPHISERILAPLCQPQDI